jgi:elongation factor G
VIERLAEVDDEIGELFLMEEEPDIQTIKAAIRRQTIACKFVPVFMGSAFKNKGVQTLLDGVLDFLPAPDEKDNFAMDRDNNEELVALNCDPEAPLLALAFKLEEGKFGQLTYMRIYQGALRRGNFVINVMTGKKIKVPRIVRMHSDDMEEIQEALAGDVVAMFGVDCSSMDTFSDGINYAMTSMFVPNPVMSLSVKPAKSANQNSFGKALQKFSKEDPTLRISTDPNTSETILSGMGELHLEVYIERMKREYDVVCEVGQPSVSYKECINTKVHFEHLHKKQSGGSGQYAKVSGYIEPLTEEEQLTGMDFEFINECIGTNIPPEYIPSCEKGAKEASAKGGLIGHEVKGLRVCLQDGQAHNVDSSDMAFKICMSQAIRIAMKTANPAILEPVMKVEVVSPGEFQGAIVSGLNRRMGLIQESDVDEDAGVRIVADMPLNNMFGYSTDLRSITQGKGEFTMEYSAHQPVMRDLQEKMIKEHQAELAKSHS